MWNLRPARDQGGQKGQMKGALRPSVTMVSVLALGLGLVMIQPCLALDKRIKTLEFNDHTVVKLEGCVNFQTMIRLDEDEHIENVGVGDSNQWQVMPNKRANLLFVKPLSPTAFSNMTVVSDKHAYSFELNSASEKACKRGDVVYDLRFHYPETKPVTNPSATALVSEPVLPVPEKRNTAYTYQGARDLVPLRVFDDGKSTYFSWADQVSVPALYVQGPDKSESLVNYANRGGYVVVEQVAKVFVLRRGEQSTLVYNDSYSLTNLDDQSPKLKDKSDAASSSTKKPFKLWGSK